MIAPRILVLGSEALGVGFLSYLVEQSILDGKVAITTSPQEALDRVRTEEFHVLLADMDVPGASGMEFLQATQRLCPRPTLVPMVSERTLLPEDCDYMVFGCLRKPLCFSTMSEVVMRAAEFNLLHRRAERFVQVLGHLPIGGNAFADQLRGRLADTEAHMRDLWEHERTQPGHSEPSDADIAAVLEDPTFGWSMETFLFDSMDKGQKNKKGSKVA